MQDISLKKILFYFLFIILKENNIRNSLLNILEEAYYNFIVYKFVIDVYIFKI